jgi:hypothetical protein
MTTIIYFLVANIASIGCVAAACICAVNRVSGWGWFLFVALLLSESFKNKEESE